jgi:signal recognition particle subunit SRP54
MINSMTLQERRNRCYQSKPEIAHCQRKWKRYCRTKPILKQFEQMKDMMKMMNKMPMGKMPGMMGKR